MRILSTLLALTFLSLTPACDQGSEEEPPPKAQAQEPCAADSDCIAALFCHPTEKLCVISEDPCVGVTYSGICDNEGAVIWCEDNALKGIDCPELGKVCDFNAEKGVYDCVEAE